MYVLSVQYSCAVVSVFLFGGKANLVLKKTLQPEKKVPVVCLAGESVFGSGGKLAFFSLWRESFITTGKKRYSHLSGGCAIIITTGKKNSLRPEKKSSSHLSGGCVSFWFWQEIGSFFVAAGKFYYYRKKRYSRLSGGCTILVQLELNLIQIQ